MVSSEHTITISLILFMGTHFNRQPTGDWKKIAAYKVRECMNFLCPRARGCFACSIAIAI